MNIIENLETKYQRSLTIDLGDSYVTVLPIGTQNNIRTFCWLEQNASEGGVWMESEPVTEQQVIERITKYRGDSGLENLDHQKLKLFFN